MRIRFHLFTCALLFLVFLLLPPTLHAQQYDWARQFSGTGLNYTHSIAVDHDQNVILLGNSDGGVDLDPGPGTALAPGVHNFIVKLDSNGLFLWGGPITSTSGNNLLPMGLVCDAAGNIYAVGHVQGQADFDIGPGVDMQGPPTGHLGTYFTRYSASGQYLGTKILNDISSHLEPSGNLAIDDQANLYFVGGKDE